MILFLAEKIELALQKESKDKVSKWIQNISPQNAISSWPAAFVEIFDHIFGKHHFSCRCFYRSCIASTFSVLIMTLVWGYLRPYQFQQFFNSGSLVEAFLSVYLVGIIVNLIPDYLSLLETRWLINKMDKSGRIISILLYLCLDLVITSAIFLIFIAFCMFMVFLLRVAFPNTTEFVNFLPKAIQNLVIRVTKLKMTFSGYKEWLLHFTGNCIPLTTDKKYEPSPGIWMYSTFFTSIWAWLHATTGIIAKCSQKLFGSYDWFIRNFDINEKPLSVMGIISIVLLTMLFIIAPFLW